MEKLNSNSRPEIVPSWKLVKHENKEEFALISSDKRAFGISPVASKILMRLFNGKYTIKDIQHICSQEEFGSLPPEYIEQLCLVLFDNSIISIKSEPERGNLQHNNSDSNADILTNESKNQSQSWTSQVSSQIALNTSESSLHTLGLRKGLEWIQYPENIYYLRNPFDVTYFKVSGETKRALEQFGYATRAEIKDEFGWEDEDINQLEENLKKLNMLDSGVTEDEDSQFSITTPWNRIPLWNPDAWLNQKFNAIHFLWYKQTKIIIGTFLVFTFIVSLSLQEALAQEITNLVSHLSIWTVAQFLIFIIFVISLHELGHAFTLKSYGMKVPQIGVILGLMPGIYTDTTDSYGLKHSIQRFWVMAAGVICQVLLWSIGFWIWFLAKDGTWLADSAYIFMVASSFSLVINLNPLTKLDGYYLLVAITQTEDLKQRSFAFYRDLFQERKVVENKSKILILLLYAPLSLGYSLFILGRLFLFFGNNIATQIPIILLIFIISLMLFSLTSRGMEIVPSFKVKIDNYKDNPTSETIQLNLPRPLLEFIKVAKKPVLFLVIISFVGSCSLPTSVTGEAIISSSQGARRVVSMPRDGLIEYVIQANSQVNIGDRVLQISSEDLNKEIEDISIQKLDAQTKVDSIKLRISSLQERLEYLESTLRSYQPLYEIGAVPLQNIKEINLEKQNTLSEIDTLRAELLNSENMVLTLGTRLSRLEEQKNNLTILASVQGTIIGQDLDRLEGRIVPRGEALFEIADLSELTANVSVRQVYSDLIQEGAEAIFRPTNLANKEYSARVTSIPSALNKEVDSTQKINLSVPILIRNDGNLRINETGYASIKTDRQRLYQIAFRELADVLPLQRFMPIFLGL